MVLIQEAREIIEKSEEMKGISQVLQLKRAFERGVIEKTPLIPVIALKELLFLRTG